jgi:predicted nucleic acid-binding protein
MIVVDASALLELLLRTSLGARVEARLLADDQELHAPHLLDVEIGSGFAQKPESLLEDVSARSEVSSPHLCPVLSR